MLATWIGTERSWNARSASDSVHTPRRRALAVDAAPALHCHSSVRALAVFLAAFVASACSGTVPLATATLSPSPRPSPSASPRPVPVAPAGFTVGAGAEVDVFAEAAIDKQAIASVQEAGDRAAVQIEKYFGEEFRYRPTIYLFASAESVRRVLIGHLEYPADTAELVTGYGAASLRNWSVAANWALLAGRNPALTLTHELTHTMVGQFDHTGERVPGWLNEGLAMLQELSVEGTDWLAAEIRYTTFSMAHTGTLLSFLRLRSQATYRTDPALTRGAYMQSAQAAMYLVEDIGRDGLLKILADVRDGETVKVAYLTHTGKKEYDFEDRFPERARALGSGPGLVTTAGAARGNGPTLLAYGFPPSTAMAVRLQAGRQTWDSSGTTTPFGTYQLALDTVPVGQFAAAATAGSVTVRATVNIAR